MCDIYYLISVFSRLQHVREEFIRLGFILPVMKLDRIESVRVRPVDEQSYDFYSAERLLESLSFPKGRWLRNGRKTVVLSYRSAYIDMLCSRYMDRDTIYGDDSSDVPEAYRQAMERNADPNYLLYSRLDMTNEVLIQQHISDTIKQLEFEVVSFAPTLEKILNGARRNSLAKKNISKLFASAAEIFGLSYSAGAYKPVLLKLELGEGCSLCLDWSDDLVLRKWGRLQLTFSITVQMKGEAEDSSKFECDLEALIPGGEWYTRTDGDMNRIALGILAHVQFMRLLSDQAQQINGNKS